MGYSQLHRKLEETLTSKTGFNDYFVEHELESVDYKKVRISGRPIEPGLDEEVMILVQIENLGEKA